jgi:hypothetical protein
MTREAAAGEVKMSTDKEHLNKAQIEEINKLIQGASEATVRSIQKNIVAAIQDNERRLLADLETKVNEAIKNNQRVIITTVQDGAIGEAGGKKGGAMVWQVLTLALPVMLTALLGLYVDRRIEGLKSRLDLTSEFYKKKLSVYENNHKQMVVLIEALHNAQIDPVSKATAIESLHNLNQGYTVDSLYISNDLLKKLRELYKAGVDMPAVRPSGKGNIATLMTKVSDVEDQMKKDLHLDEIGQINIIFDGSK